MSKHLLLYTDDPGLGGVAQYNQEILSGLVALGYRVTCVQGKSDNPLVNLQRELGIQHVWLEFDTVKDFGRTVINRADAQNILTIYKPDFIIFSDSCPLSNFAAKQVAIELGIAYIAVIGFVAPYLAERFAAYLDELSRQYTQAKAVIAVSNENLTLLHELFRLPKDKGQVIYYGRSTQYFALPTLSVRERLRQEFDIPSNAVVCFTAARLEFVKGYQYQLEAIKQLKQSEVWHKVHFVWAGAGNLETQLKEAVEQLGVSSQVKLLGQRWDVLDWLDASDIFILPSELEGMPLCIMEAMAKGLPVIASAVSGIPEELGDTGKLLPSPQIHPQATVQELVTTLQAWSVNPELRHSIGQACKKRAEKMFRKERMVKETVEVIEHTLLPVGDYVSPGFSIVWPDKYFPNMIVGDTSVCAWPYLRREVPHNWYVDKRYPDVGFLNRDEAHILYNTALKFKGKKALELGCWLGWSACHLALAGVELDVIDPLLARPEFYESVSNSLRAAGVLDSVNLITGYSPQKVEELVDQLQRKWSLIFIDGNHDAPGPLNDAIACEKFAEADALILFHDLPSPDVVQGLDYLKQRGWKTMVYQTMQIMGVAWRGNVAPVRHHPDSKINWKLPNHLQHYPVSSLSNALPALNANEPLINQLFCQIEKVKSDLNAQSVNRNFPQKLLIERNQKGKKFYVQGELDQALIAFTEAIEVNPGSVVAQNYLSSLYWQKGEVQKSLQHHLFAQSANIVFSGDRDDEFRELIAAVRPYTLLSEARLFSLYSLARQICLDDIPGNFVECGTCKGGSAALLAVAIKRYSLRPRLIYAFDTFEGMPDPTEVDRHNGLHANLTGFGAGALKAPISENLDVVCQSLNVRDIVIPVQGLFVETLPQYKSQIGSIALLHADGDWYKSTMDIFNTLFDSVVSDGIIQIDDYGHWEGCRKAVHEFERRRGESFALRSIDYTGVWFRKEDPVHYDCSHWHTFWYLAQAAEKMGNADLAERSAHAVLQIVPRLTKAEEMLVRLKKSVDSPHFLNLLSGCIEQYQREPAAQSVLAELCQIRKQIANFWLATAEDKLESAYFGHVGKAHQMLLNSGIKDEPLTDTEQTFVDELLAHISGGFDEPKAIQYLLATILYRRADQLSLQHDLPRIPSYLLKDYIKFILYAPVYFQDIGEADNYYYYMQRWIDYLHTSIFNYPDSALWRDVATQCLQLANFIPLYFNNFNLKDIYIKRAEVLEFALKLSDQKIDYEFTDRPLRRKMRLGILAAHFTPTAETFASLPVYEYISRDFEVILYSLTSSGHRLEQYCQSCANSFKLLPNNLIDQVNCIRVDDLDILFIATNITAVSNQICLLSLHRLARVQATSVASIVTTGMQSIDYYISGKLTETYEEAEQHYQEKLLKLNGPAHCFSYGSEQNTATIKVDRESLNISKEAVVFVSVANLFKITPELSDTWAKIIASTPNSVLILFPYGPNWSSTYAKEPFLKRMITTFSKYGVEKDRLLILDPDPVPNRDDIKEYLKITDLYLDSYPFSGTTSLIDPLEVGLPIVSKQGTTFRSSMGAALLQELAVPDLVADSEESYIKLAIALGTNPELRKQKSEQIKQRMQANPRFLDSRSYSAQMGTLFQELFRKHQAIALTDNLKLRDINLIIFPDWSQPEDLLYQDLASVIIRLVKHPDKNQMTLLIDTGNLSEDEANFLLSDVVMNLLLEEDLDVANGPEISLVQLSEMQWETLLPRIQARIVLENENQQAIAGVRAETIPSYNLDSFI